MRREAFRLRVPAPTLAAVGEALERLEAWAMRERVRFERRRELLLVFDELASNVAKYAHGASELVVEARREPEGGLALVLEDDGPEFDPFARPDPDTAAALAEREPGGLGVHLVRRLAARAAHRRLAGRNRIEIELAP